MNNETNDERAVQEQRREQCFADAGGEREFTPQFGDTIRGIWASEKNPQRDGIYIRTVRETGRVNSGTFYELTDGKGTLWRYWSRDTVRVARASAATQAEPEPDADLRDWLIARRDNALRIAAAKHSDDSEGWLEDADYFQRAVAAVAAPVVPPVALPALTDEWFDEAMRLIGEFGRSMKHLLQGAGYNKDADSKLDAVRTHLSKVLAASAAPAPGQMQPEETSPAVQKAIARFHAERRRLAVVDMAQEVFANKLHPLEMARRVEELYPAPLVSYGAHQTAAGQWRANLSIPSDPQPIEQVPFCKDPD